ncbi:MAG: hypothetical protein ACKV2T_43920 [Kofleriaceae bacterium]
MSERGNGKIIAGAVVALAAIGGGAYWFFGIRAKNEQQNDAQAEILAWETRLAAARTCLFGEKPASSDSGEALAVRELTPDPWDRSTCTKLVGALARGVADDTGLMPVEHAWMTLGRAAAKVATSFAVSKDPYGKTAADERRGVSDLPDALRELDKAHADLRQAAKLPPASASTVPALPAAQVVPMLIGGAQITGIDLFPRSSAGTLVMWGVTKDTPVQITLVPGAAPRIEKVPAFTVRGFAPEGRYGLAGAWGAAGLGGGIAVGSIDDKGVFAAPQTISPTGGSLLAAVGPFDDSLVAFASSEGIVFAHGKGNPPAFTLDKPISAGMTQIAFDPIAGRALISWAELPPPSKRALDDESDAPTALVGAIVQNGAQVQTVQLGSGSPSVSCLSRRHGYVVTYQDVLRFDASGATPLEVDTDKFSLEGCGAGGALFADAGTTQYTACGDNGCRLVDLRGARPTEHAALANDHVVSIAVRERVLAVWSEKSPPAFYRLPEKVVPRKVISDGKTIDVLAESATENKPLHYVLVRVPAT